MPLFPGPSDSCLYIDPNAGLTDDNLWRDLSPFACHVTPVGYAAPAYGIATGPSGAKMITFNGANQWGTLPVRFYANAPLNTLTVAAVMRHNSPLASDRIFSCENGAGTRGFVFSMSTAERTRIGASDAAGAACINTNESTDAPYTSRTRVTIFSATSLVAASRCWVDRVGVTTAVGVNGNPIAYDLATTPNVGRFTGGGLLFDGDLYFLGIWGRIWSDQESKAFSDYWRNVT